MVQRKAGWLAVVGLGAIGAGAWAQAQSPLFAAIFDDHVVLQRDRPNEVWGRATPGEQVTVTLSNVTRTTQTGADGRWKLTLPTFPAGGPHVLSARAGSQRQTVSDVLVGDVWLCSGQSNMEWTVRNALNADWEVAHSANDRIRHVKIPRLAAVSPRADFAAPLAWKVAGPRTTQDFSAVCYYFARELQKMTQVPQGLVHASWGGTRIETWLSADMLRTLGGNDDKLELLELLSKDRAAAAGRWGDVLQRWWLSQPATQGVQPWAIGRANSGEWRPAPATLGYWESWNVPGLEAFDGVLWYRAHVKVSPAQARQAATLALGAMNDADVTWVNGRAVGTGFGEESRAYALPAKFLKSGDNIVVVNLYNMWGNGGLLGPSTKLAVNFADGSSAALSGWEYQQAPAGLGGVPRQPWEPIAGINVNYNGMIAPLGTFGFRGVAWYQGEANGELHDALRYEAQLSALFSDWRRQFAAPLSFYVVQLANWNKLVTTPVDSGWARLRDAQRRAVAADGNAGLAVTIDIGNRDDIHPTNKQDVGARLARAARHVTYGEKISPSGAQPIAARRTVRGVDVTLGDFDGSLIVIGSRDPAGFELCGESQASCHFVRAQLDGAVVHLEDASPGAATRVRYAWADAPLTNLFDATGLPVGPFELAIE